MEVDIIPAGSYMTNCYIVTDEKTNESIVIDPGDAAEKLLRAFENKGTKLKFILLTHGHADHTAAVHDFRLKYNVDVYINKLDADLIDRGEFMFGAKNQNGNKYIKDGDELSFGGLEIKCIETPGHTPGGMCYLIENCLFTGDTLFNSSIGRTDMPGGDYNAIISSIKSKIMPFKDDIYVLPGHGPKSSVGYERDNNPFF